MSHKLVQPGETRWLSYEGSISVVLKHYAAICLTLEEIYVSAGNMSCDAGGLLLTFIKSSTLLYLHLLNRLLQPLARLSKVLQSSSGNIASAMKLARATIDAIENDFKLADVEGQANLDAELVRGAGVQMENDNAALKEQRRVCEKYRDAVIKNLKIRFSDTVSQLCDVQKILRDKVEVVNFDSI